LRPLRDCRSFLDFSEYNRRSMGIGVGVSTSEAQYETGEPLPTAEVASNEPQVGRPGKGHGAADGVHHTRIGGAWVAVGVAVVLGIALVDFIVQNTRSVKVEFFSASGHMPVAVALIGAALVGAFIVLLVGIARTTQLRIANRRGKKREARAESLLNAQS
jgi:uncharacterized integral membrane protein